MNIAVTIDQSNFIMIDPRPCGFCGLTLDRHVMVDQGEGPEHFCPDILIDDLTLDEMERRAVLRIEEEIAATFARWEAMDALRPPEPPARPAPYNTPQSTIDAFWFVVRQGDEDKVVAWLADHPRDAADLLKLLESKANA